MKYKPLYLDTVTELFEPSRLQIVARWLHRIFPYRLYYELPYGRRSLESQLKARTCEPVNDWDAIGIPYHIAKPVLNMISLELNLPTSHFIPADPLELALIGDYDDDPILWVYAGVNELLELSVGWQEFQKFIADEGTDMESLVRYVLDLER